MAIASVKDAATGVVSYQVPLMVIAILLSGLAMRRRAFGASETLRLPD